LLLSRAELVTSAAVADWRKFLRVCVDIKPLTLFGR
jgi:hypothetical protein